MTGSPYGESSDWRYRLNGYGSPEHLFGELIREFVRMDVYGPCEDEVEVHNAPAFVPHDTTSPVLIYVMQGAEDDELIAYYILAAAIRWQEDSWERNRRRTERVASDPRRRPIDPHPSRPSDGTREKGSSGEV